MKLPLSAATAIIVFFPAVSGSAQDLILPKSGGDSGNSGSSPQTFQWEPAFRQSMYFLTVQQGFRIAFQSETRRELRGPYFNDWLTSVGNLRGWDDGDSVMANYVGHAMEGAIASYIQVQNDPRYRKVRFGDEGYWKSRFKAYVYSAVYSANYELGPLGDGAIGNVGKTPGTKGAVDLVMTPTVGMGWMMTEDLLDRHFISHFESRVQNRTARMMVRSWLNPSRSMANILRGKWPWYRDDRGGLSD
jgi:hypothetical protein